MSILWLAEPETQPMNALQRMNHMNALSRKLECHAIEVCTLAFSCDSESVWVNAFGPIAFCKYFQRCFNPDSGLIEATGGPWLRDVPMRMEMTKELEKWGKVTGWPISIIADALSPLTIS